MIPRRDLDKMMSCVSPRIRIPKNVTKERKNKNNAIEKALKELVNDEWIIVLAKRTGGGSDDHLSLNPHKVSEIQQFLVSVI